MMQILQIIPLSSYELITNVIYSKHVFYLSLNLAM